MNAQDIYDLYDQVIFEKTAAAIAEDYGVDRLPPGYAEALMEKEALLNTIKNLGQGLVRSGAQMAEGAKATAKASDIATRSGTHWRSAANATFGQQMKTHGANAMQRVGQFATAKPGQALGVAGATGAAGLGAGYLATR